MGLNAHPMSTNSNLLFQQPNQKESLEVYSFQLDLSTKPDEVAKGDIATKGSGLLGRSPYSAAYKRTVNVGAYQIPSWDSHTMYSCR